MRQPLTLDPRWDMRAAAPSAPSEAAYYRRLLVVLDEAQKLCGRKLFQAPGKHVGLRARMSRTLPQIFRVSPGLFQQLFRACLPINDWDDQVEYLVLR